MKWCLQRNRIQSSWFKLERQERVNGKITTHILFKVKSMPKEDGDRSESPMSIQKKKGRAQEDKETISLRHRYL